MMGQSSPAARGPVRVCHLFSGDLWAGAEVAIFNLLTGLARDPGVTVLALSLNEGTITERLRAAGIATHVVPESRHGMLGLLWRAGRILRDADVSILHSHRYKENVLAALLAAWLRVPTLITTIHGLSESPSTSARDARRARRRSRLDYLVVRRAFAAAVAVSDEMRHALTTQYGFAPAQVEVIRNGGRFPARSAVARRSNGGPFHIGTVGRMVPVKGLDLFLDAAAALRRRAPGVRFSILGDGPLREDLVRRARDLGIDDCTDFVPPRPDPFPFYDSLDVYVNTSHHEGLPLSVVEAMACGKPIVSAAVGGIPEVVTHGEHGFLVREREPGLFADWYLTLMRDDALRARMGECAAATAHGRLSADAMAGAYRRLYDRCLAEARPAAWRARLVRAVRAEGRRVVEHIESRRAEALRRNPEALERRLRSVRTVLVLCQGNVSRSVFAANLLAAALEDRPDVVVRSAGLGTQPGWRAHPRVIARCADLDIDVRAHASRPVTPELVADADVVLVMEVAHLVEMTRRFPIARWKTFLLTTLAPGVPMDIEDPAGKPDAEVDACLDHVRGALTPLIRALHAREGAAR
jgi:glycosyltransferase involved in cell wall biosynthesis/protein-tyrosine-phosphatase